jgi:hypothetical protein
MSLAMSSLREEIAIFDLVSICLRRLSVHTEESYICKSHPHLEFVTPSQQPETVHISLAYPPNSSFLLHFFLLSSVHSLMFPSLQGTSSTLLFLWTCPFNSHEIKFTSSMSHLFRTKVMMKEMEKLPGAKWLVAKKR